MIGREFLYRVIFVLVHPEMDVHDEYYRPIDWLLYLVDVFSYLMVWSIQHITCRRRLTSLPESQLAFSFLRTSSSLVPFRKASRRCWIAPWPSYHFHLVTRILFVLIDRQQPVLFCAVIHHNHNHYLIT